MFGSIVARRSVLGATGLSEFAFNRASQNERSLSSKTPKENVKCLCRIEPCLRTTFPALAIQRRLVQTRSITPQEDIAILNSQRQKRPSSPHFTIYQPQVS